MSDRPYPEYVQCPKCYGEGQIVVGEYRATQYCPAEYKYGDCFECSATGKIKDADYLKTERRVRVNEILWRTRHD